jgi:hypothetical protein
MHICCLISHLGSLAGLSTFKCHSFEAKRFFLFLQCMLPFHVISHHHLLSGKRANRDEPAAAAASDAAATEDVQPPSKVGNEQHAF